MLSITRDPLVVCRDFFLYKEMINDAAEEKQAPARDPGKQL